MDHSLLREQNPVMRNRNREMSKVYGYEEIEKKVKIRRNELSNVYLSLDLYGRFFLLLTDMEMVFVHTAQKQPV